MSLPKYFVITKLYWDYRIFQNSIKPLYIHIGVVINIWRLRLSRGLFRHNLQAVMDLEDFITNRTNEMPQTIFKSLGDSAFKYINSSIDNLQRSSTITTTLKHDNVENVKGLTIKKIKKLCSSSVYQKASRRFKVINSMIISTQISASKNYILGENRSISIYDQQIFWGSENQSCEFTLETINVYCDCKYFNGETRKTGFCCSHIIGQMVRTLYLCK